MTTKKRKPVHPRHLVNLQFSYRPVGRNIFIPGYQVAKIRITDEGRLKLRIQEPGGRTLSEFDLATALDLQRKGQIRWKNPKVDLERIQIPRPSQSS